jgi:chromate transporter
METKAKRKISIIKLWQLFAAFFKIGMFTFGGGFAMIAIMENEFVTKRNWITKEDIMDMVIVAESTPGGVAINAAIFIGHKVGGFLAAFIGAIGIVLPSYLIVAAIYFVLGSILDNIWVAAAFKGIRICVVVLIFRAILSLFKMMEHNWFGYILLLAAFGVTAFTNFNVIYVILIGAVLGIIYTSFAKKDKLPAANIAESRLSAQKKSHKADGEDNQ